MYHPDKHINALIISAIKIDALAEKQQERTKDWQQLAKDARNPDIDRAEIQQRKSQLDQTNVLDFGTAIDDLRLALKKIHNIKSKPT
jgi:hypothetical protein